MFFLALGIHQTKFHKPTLRCVPKGTYILNTTSTQKNDCKNSNSLQTNSELRVQTHSKLGVNIQRTHYKQITNSLQTHNKLITNKQQFSKHNKLTANTQQTPYILTVNTQQAWEHIPLNDTDYKENMTAFQEDEITSFMECSFSFLNVFVTQIGCTPTAKTTLRYHFPENQVFIRLFFYEG